MFKRFRRKERLKALLAAAATMGVLALLLIGQVIPARSAPGSQPAAQETPAGDPERGQALFMGQAHLENDGPPCISCHNVSGNGLLGGGSLGPDLTNVPEWYNQAGLASALAEVSFPTMKPIYAEHPLTPAEQADLIAFLLASEEPQKSNLNTLVVMGFGLFGCVAAAGFFGFVYRRRLRGVRQALVSHARLPRRIK